MIPGKNLPEPQLADAFSAGPFDFRNNGAGFNKLVFLLSLKVKKPQNN